MAKSKGKSKSKAVGDTTAKPAPAKKHERKVKPSEAERLEKGRRLAATYLEQRDGMDPQLALDIVEGMDAEAINALVAEANGVTIEKTKANIAKAEAKAEGKAELAGAVLAEEPVPDFTTIPQLAGDERFAVNVDAAVQAARIKNDAEKEYKICKRTIIAILQEAKVVKVACRGVKMEVYEGHTRTLDQFLLMEKGVPLDTINECWKDTPYWDVRMVAPKAAKVAV